MHIGIKGKEKHCKQYFLNNKEILAISLPYNTIGNIKGSFGQAIKDKIIAAVALFEV